MMCDAKSYYEINNTEQIFQTLISLDAAISVTKGHYLYRPSGVTAICDFITSKEERQCDFRINKVTHKSTKHRIRVRLILA